MRLNCDVETVNRVLASHNLKKPSRTCHAQVSLGRKASANPAKGCNQLFLMVCTSKDRNGAKYVIKDNISQLFVKFVNEGKATIRFRVPEQDLCLSKADPIQLKGLLSLIRAAAQGEGLEKMTLSSLAPASTKQVEKPRTELTVLKRKEYPLTSRFPSSLEVLTIHSCGMKRVDPRILHLSKLHSLDLSHNALSSLPEDWGKINALTRLIITDNKLTTLPSCLWRSQVRETLIFLDIRNNFVNTLSLQICELKQLVCLRLDSNGLENVPPTIGKLTKLRNLSLAQNKVSRLPAGFTKLCLETLDVSDNPFDTGETGVTGAQQLGFPTLLECVARTIRKQRIPYTEEDLFPHLFHYLSAARQCWCGNYCFACSARYLTQASLRHLVADCYTASPGVESVPVEGFLCSQYCLTRFQQNPQAYWRS